MATTAIQVEQNSNKLMDFLRKNKTVATAIDAIGQSKEKSVAYLRKNEQKVTKIVGSSVGLASIYGALKLSTEAVIIAHSHYAPTLAANPNQWKVELCKDAAITLWVAGAMAAIYTVKKITE